MSAETIAQALGVAGREGRNWRCRCPVCGGTRSLSVKDGDSGKVLVTCWAGCTWQDVRDALRDRGLLPRHERRPRQKVAAPAFKPIWARDPADVARQRRELDDERAITLARQIWSDTVDAAGTLVEQYLRSRRLILPAAGTLRFHTAAPRPERQPPLPAMAAVVTHEKHGFVGVHLTYLTPDGRKHAAGKVTFGRPDGGAIRLAAPIEGQPIVIGEGIENVLTVMQACDRAGWAARCANGIEHLILPSGVRHILIAADNDENGVGQRAANLAGWRWQHEGREVKVALPPRVGIDFNDIYTGRAYAKIIEAPDAG